MQLLLKPQPTKKMNDQNGCPEELPQTKCLGFLSIAYRFNCSVFFHEMSFPPEGWHDGNPKNFAQMMRRTEQAQVKQNQQRGDVLRQQEMADARSEYEQMAAAVSAEFMRNPKGQRR